MRAWLVLLFVLVFVGSAAHASERPMAGPQPAWSVEQVAVGADTAAVNDAFWKARRSLPKYRLASGLGLVGGAAGFVAFVAAAFGGDASAAFVGLVAFGGGAAVLVGSEIGTVVSLRRMANLLEYRDGVLPLFKLGVATTICAVLGVPAIPLYGVGVPLLIASAVLAEAQARDLERAWMYPGERRARLELRFTGTALVGRF